LVARPERQAEHTQRNAKGKRRTIRELLFELVGGAKRLHCGSTNKTAPEP
jgi:hypothetical protein